MPPKRKSPPDAVVTLAVKSWGLAPILGAAYLMMDRAWVLVEGDRKKSLTVVLRPKAGRSAKDLAALKAAFRAELESQKLRWAVAEGNRSIREFVAENAVSLAQQRAAAPAPAEAPPDQLTDAQRAEIERLIAEVETEIKDMNARKFAPDPKGVKASWEASSEAEKGSGAA